MRATIDGVVYDVWFRHTTLPGHDRRVRPTYEHAMNLLAVIWRELKHPGVSEQLGLFDLEEMVEQAVLDDVGASLRKSHATECFILSTTTKAPWNDRIVSSGQTQCDKRDNFDKAEGRWLAFERAIDAFPVDAQLDWIEWYADSPMRKPKLLAQCPEKTPCQLPPSFWRCTRSADHDGPCAAVPTDVGSARASA